MLPYLLQEKEYNLNEKLNVLGINKEAQAFYVWSLFCVSKKSIIVVTNSLYEANSLYKKLVIYSSKNVLLFPMDDFLVSEALAISPDFMATRISALDILSKNDDNYIVITNLMGYLRFLPEPKLWSELTLKVSKESILNRKEFIQKLNLIGYRNTSLVSKTGDYAVRGFIIDIYPMEYEQPVRIEMFDNIIDDIRTFNVDNQLSIKKIDEVEIKPITEFINLKNKDVPPRQGLLAEVLDNVSSISDFLKDNITLYLDYDNILLGYSNLMEQTLEYRQTDSYKIEKYMFDLQSVVPNKYININSFDQIDKEEYNVVRYVTKSIELFNNNYEKIKLFIEKEILSKNKIIVFLSDPSMINDFTNNIGLKCILTNTNNINSDYVNIIEGKLPNGFIINDYVILTDNEIYKKTEVIKYKKSFNYGTKIKDINKLEIGDYVVHSSHGVGRYLGIITLDNNGIKKDYIHIQYKGNDKLYIPVEKIEYINKYSSNEGVVPNLNKLNGTDWVRQKARVKDKVKDIARQLLEVSVQRKLKKGFSFLPDDAEQYKFENSFIYEPTNDQLKAIAEIKKDMEKEFPMDRLLCGDVGYGKTEVAFRAIFKAVRSCKQVCFLCPTTILSKQHYESAIDRFKDFGVNIEVLNRFVSEKRKKEIIDGLKSGKIDVIIGTHNLLNKNITYKDLGLLIIDEEQRFGVIHKERIKEYKSDIDILTLSATPIPRTLQMSLTGIRELSLIETPPKYRYPVQTYVLKESKQIIKDAIYKELSRDGQVFVLYNRVTNIDDKIAMVKELVPEASVACIHGRMNKLQIEDAMDKFANGDYDVLVCTTIIETGIDIQNANTLIVLDADRFGLSQLYQIRGRIGRGKNIGYAYLMYNPNKILNEIAEKRLSAIKEFTELGSGYALAMRDLSIRGAGDILGSMQSGFIDSIGYDMYIKILNEEVQKLKGDSVSENDLQDENKVPYLKVATHIDDVYASSEDIKIEIHKKINTIDSYEKLDKITLELKDRFGELSEDIKVYMREELFESLAKQKGVASVTQLQNKITVVFNKDTSSKINGAVLLTRLFKLSKAFSVEYKLGRIEVSLGLTNLEKHFVYYLLDLLEIIE